MTDNSPLWEIVKSRGGRPRIFNDPVELWDSAADYFQWCEENQLSELKPFAYQGCITDAIVPKMRAYTLAGLWLHSGLSKSSWYDYKAKPEYSEVCAQIEAIIYEQKFTGAAADLLNPAIIARDLGLADKTEITGANGGAVQIEHTVDPAKLSDSTLAELLAARVNPAN